MSEQLTPQQREALAAIAAGRFLSAAQAGAVSVLNGLGLVRWTGISWEATVSGRTALADSPQAPASAGKPPGYGMGGRPPHDHDAAGLCGRSHRDLQDHLRSEHGDSAFADLSWGLLEGMHRRAHLNPDPAAPDGDARWKDLVTRLVEESRACECPHGSCPVYPHPVLREAAAATGWVPPPGEQL